jgi:site-specific recombinase XerD
MSSSCDLPPFAQEFIEAHPPSRPVVRAFHRWLKSTHRPLRQLVQREVEVFLLRFPRKSPTNTQRQNRGRALRYFDWLLSRNLLGFDPRCAWPRSNFPLPVPATHFIESLVPTTKASTVNGYRTALRQFHIWLDSQSVTLAALDRDTIARWLQWLHSRGLHPSTRTSAIIQVRMYLRWLDERGLLAHPADFLIRRSDFPKLPQYLPRPLPPDVDANLQARLARSECMYKLALLLMRRTGLRIGELVNLSYGCIRTSPKGERFLKVPLGKLDNERLVPLDKRTLRTLNKLRRMGARRRTLLLEHAPGRPARYDYLREALRNAVAGLSDAEPVTPHRLRHTYATTMLAGGMSLVAVMRLLGHKDYRMTLRYAAITDETVLAEFAAALESNKHRYDAPGMLPPLLDPDPAKQLSDLARQLLARVQDDHLDVAKARNLARRLRRLATEVRRLEKRSH